MMKLNCDIQNPPIDVVILSEYLRELKVTIEWGKSTKLDLKSGTQFTNANSILRYLTRLVPKKNLYGQTLLQNTEVDHWITYRDTRLKDDLEANLAYLDRVLSSVTYLVGHSLTLADIVVWSALRLSQKWHNILNKEAAPRSVCRWYRYLHDLETFNLSKLPSEVKNKLELVKQMPKKVENAQMESPQHKDEGKFVDLPGAEMGKVVVRFPPEASGFLHIGHAKAALLNQHYQQSFQGKLIMRFDDTNPSKEKEDFEKVILEDVALLQIKPDIYSYTSDYFDLMSQKCEELIKKGKAYVDDTDPEIMKMEREQRKESKNRNNSVEKNLEMWNEMKNGTQYGQQCCVRAKIDMNSDNGCMRDPTLYRYKNELHPRTGDKYKVYPTYDFACPIVDSVEGVTHALRTTEYHDRDDQYFWILDALGMNKHHIYEYSRLNMMNTVLSKRKLTWFVENKIVDGWEDPRMPTVRGVLRRGMTVEGLKQFIVAQGSSRSVVVMDWDKIWAFNRKVIDPIAPRYSAVEKENAVEVIVHGAQEEPVQISKHPKNPDIGMKTVWIGPKLLIDSVDAEAVKEGDNVTFINWGNLLIKSIKKNENGKIEKIEASLNLDNKDYKKTLKVTWVAVTDKASLVPCICIYYDHIISKPILGKDDDFKSYIGHNTKTEVSMLGDSELANLKKSDIIQLQRKGFFICDEPYDPSTGRYIGRESPLVLISVPDGSKDTNILPKVVIEKRRQETAKEQMNRLKGKSAEKSPQEEPVTSFAEASVEELSKLIKETGDKVRALKTEKAGKEKIDSAVKVLLELKAKYKSLSGKEWKPDDSAAKPPEKDVPVLNDQLKNVEAELSNQIKAQGDKIQVMKSQKVDNQILDSEIKILLNLKASYKDVIGKEWKPQSSNNAKQETNLSKQTRKEQELENKNNVQQDQNISGKIGANEYSASSLNSKIKEQGDKIRKMKAEKVSKDVLAPEIKILLDLKAEFKNITGTEWKPNVDLPIIKDHVASQDDADKGNAKDNESKRIKTSQEDKQGNEVNQQNQNISEKVDANEYSASSLNSKIKEQGDKIRKMKAEKVSKDVLTPEIKILLDLKAEFKNITGIEWKPNVDLPIIKDHVANQDDADKGNAKDNESIRIKTSQEDKQGNEVNQQNQNISEKIDANEYSASSLNSKIKEQGDKIRKMKAEKVSKDVLTPEIKILLDLKAEFKNITGIEWKPNVDLPIIKDHVANQDDADKGNAKDNESIRIKTSQKDKTEIEKMEVSKLSSSASDTKKEKKSPAKDKQKTKGDCSKTQLPDSVATPSLKKVTRLGMEAKKEENLADWYSQVITKGELIDYYDVSGCYILRPWSYAIWERIKEYFDSRIKKIGVQNCYFPMFVSGHALEREKTHIADFAPEVAWVTRSGSSELAEPIAIRPTSETVMYPSYAKWIKSHRDLPLQLNQWCNVVRWEFKHPQPFLRTREFLWQEGHSAFATQEEAVQEVHTILEMYADVYEKLLAIPVIRGRKTEKEKFAGGDFTTTIEGYISASGRAIQAGTSHHLGQNFSKMFEIVFEDPETNEKKFVYQNSWGLTTRTIGVMVMVHGDNLGLVLPPQVATIQVVIVPCGITASLSEDAKNDLLQKCEELEHLLENANIRVKRDCRDNYSPGWKFNHWELKGVPVRVELGIRDIKQQQLIAVRRDTGEKLTLAMKNAEDQIHQLLNEIQENLYCKAQKDLRDHLTVAHEWDDFVRKLNNRYIIQSPFCGETECEDKIKKDSAKSAEEVAEVGAPSMGAKSLCIPFVQPGKIEPDMKCIHFECHNPPKFYTLFGRSY